MAVIYPSEAEELHMRQLVLGVPNEEILSLDTEFRNGVTLPVISQLSIVDGAESGRRLK